MSEYIAMNKDLLVEIFLRLSVQSLLRLRAVCKSWCHIIDSSAFRKLHIHNDNNNNKSDDGTVYLRVTFPKVVPNKLSIKFHHNGKSLMSYESEHSSDKMISWVGSVKGLICINHKNFEVPIAICNPFLGQLKILPLTTTSTSSCEILHHSVAIGFIDEDYKVVQLLMCKKHRRLHAELYTSRSDSWSELTGDWCDLGVLDGVDLEFSYISPIKSWCNNGYLVHWLLEYYGTYCTKTISVKILSLDMKNEVFQTVTLPTNYRLAFRNPFRNPIFVFAEDEHSFRCIDFLQVSKRSNTVDIYESRCKGSELTWNHVMDVRVPTAVPLWRTGLVFLEHERGYWSPWSSYASIGPDLRGAFVYDYCARKFICRHVLPPQSRIVECRGSFVSLQN
ncbi:uncharacterized protein LOC125193833 [Salvia hispanica]|uniref:uncharacterized protein LOC125193833 n=1 Tax=Salvia hispanica TaxID=49212 RepID=UPI002009D169|nr:uncharacterized protein LOC125193833 [Salvia hispanica]